MAKTISTILGVVFLLAGIAGFVAPNLLGFHLSTVHNLVHIVTGALSLYFGLSGTLSAARTFAIAFGAVYALLGVAGFIAGSGADRMLEIGPLMLGTVDHTFHVIVGVLYLISGLLTKGHVRDGARD